MEEGKRLLTGDSKIWLAEGETVSKTFRTGDKETELAKQLTLAYLNSSLLHCDRTGLQRLRPGCQEGLVSVRRLFAGTGQNVEYKATESKHYHRRISSINRAVVGFVWMRVWIEELEWYLAESRLRLSSYEIR